MVTWVEQAECLGGAIAGRVKGMDGWVPIKQWVRVGGIFAERSCRGLGWVGGLGMNVQTGFTVGEELGNEASNRV